MKLILSIFITFLTHLNTCQAADHYFNRTALVDTGYDACIENNGTACEQNKNLLFRGEQPLEHKTFHYDADQFRERIFTYLQNFKQVYNTDATLPRTLDELKQYRIVIVNLLYDAHANGSDAEFGELTHEFQYSGATDELQIPGQHKLYNLYTRFNPNQFAFEWWPIAFTEENNPEDITLNLNWPGNEMVPVPRSHQYYKPLNFTYLINGRPYAANDESEAMDLHTLLKSIPSDSHPFLIFYHCVAGKDRTGATTMSYLMTYGGYGNALDQSKHLEKQTRYQPLSYNDALLATTANNYPKPRDGALVLAKAYCYFLKKIKGSCMDPSS